ncbi:DUF308 domain-containing protein [Pandoraea pnomenusa]|uniref:DUF308 domain-containing protein n=1 Tax=Pandoraea pnomenusa TaxID=93220 RepID=UPI0033402A10
MSARPAFSVISTVFFVIAGLFCIAVPFVSDSLLSNLFIGRMLLLCGFLHGINLFTTREPWRFVRRIPPVVVPIIIAFLIFLNDGIHARSLTVMLMIFFILDGYSKIVASLESGTRRVGKVAMVSAALSFFLAIYLAATFPAAPLPVLALFLGVDIISMGLTNFPSRVAFETRNL